jgi:hypothetical protein
MGIGGTIVYFLNGEAGQICRMNIQTTENLQILLGVHLALPIDGVIADGTFCTATYMSP